MWIHRKDRNDTTTEPGFDYEAWKANHMAFSHEAVPKWVKEVKEKYGKADTKFACVGYVLVSIDFGHASNDWTGIVTAHRTFAMSYPVPAFALPVHLRIQLS